LHSSAELVCLDADGNEIDPRVRTKPAKPLDTAGALTAMRRYITRHTDARVLLGGKLRGYQGTMPGVIEEAMMSTSEARPLYVAGGFGGASAAVAIQLGRSEPGWGPPGYPEGADGVSDALAALGEAERRTGVIDDGLTLDERRQLATTHRPGDIATLVVQGLARR
jgi:hypothetical protein